MDIFLQSLTVIIYVLLIILIAVLISFVVRAFNTLKKLDSTIDDVNNKMNKLNGVFNIVDRSADAINMVTDKLTSTIVSGVSKLFTKKTKKAEESDYE